MIRILIISIFLLISCAAPYERYQPDNALGGYSETQLGENVFRVTFRGNRYTSPERADDFCLLRSAEITIKNGFKYFLVSDSNRYTKTSTFRMPQNSYTTGSAVRVGRSVFADAFTSTFGGQTIVHNKPQNVKTIVCYNKKPDTYIPAYHAEFIVDAIKKKYTEDFKKEPVESIKKKYEEKITTPIYDFSVYEPDWE